MVHYPSYSILLTLLLDKIYGWLKDHTSKRLHFLLVIFHKPAKGRGGEYNKSSGKHDLAVKRCEVGGSSILIEPQDKEKGHIDFHVGFKCVNVFRSSLYETYKDSGVDHVDKKSEPKIG
jgi:hypothetical protein